MFQIALLAIAKCLEYRLIISLVDVGIEIIEHDFSTNVDFVSIFNDEINILQAAMFPAGKAEYSREGR